MRHRHIPALLAAVALIGTAAIGCGGEDEDTDTTTQETTSARQSEGQAGQGGDGRQRQAERGPDGDSNPDVGPVVENPTKKQLDIEQGSDNSLQTFGEDPGGDERDEVILAMRSYLAALARKDFVAACQRFSKEFREGNERLVDTLREQQGKEPVDGCAELGRGLRTVLNSGVVAADARKAANAVILRVGVEEDRAIVIFRPRNGELTHFPMVRENDEWKAFSFTPTPVKAG